MLKLITAKLLFVALSLGQFNGDANSDGATEAVASQAVAEQQLQNEVAAPAREAIAAQEVKQEQASAAADYRAVPNKKAKNYKQDVLSEPGRLAYNRGGAVGLSFGATLLGIFVAYPLMALSADIENNPAGRLSMLIGGTVLLAGALGFGPSMGQLCALGRNSNYVIPIVRAVAVVATPALTMYFMGLSTDRKVFTADDYYEAFLISSICAGAISMAWAVVDMAMTPFYIKRYIRRYEKKMGVSDLRAAPMTLENGGGMMVGFRF